MERKQDRLAISVYEMAEQLGIGRTFAYQLARQKGFPSVRIGNRIVIPLEDLREWLRNNDSAADGCGRDI